MSAAIEVISAAHRFSKRSPWLFEDVDLTVAKASSTAIMGRSGSGKSTLLSIILGLFPPERGQVKVLGSDWSQLTASQRAAHRANHVGVVFQFGELIDELTPLENVVLPALWGGVPPAEARTRGMELLEQVRVRTDARSTSLVSGGERQRIAVARALINAPDVVVADEPTGSLDQESADGIRELLFDLPRTLGCALVVVTHSATVAASADSVIHLTGAAGPRQ